MSQLMVDNHNQRFWSELCGTGLAKSIGITENDSGSLQRFDQEYFNIYPYLKKYVPADLLRQKKVLEIGLGYGTLSQYLAQCGAIYHGLDIAAEPVEMVNHRLQLLGCSEGGAAVGSALDIPHPDDYFDFVFSIGCLHHTGDLQRAVDEVHRVLCPGGRACIMVYNRYSLRLLVTNLKHQVKAVRLRAARDNPEFCETVRSMYDANADGDAAPHTDYTSVREAKRIFATFEKVSIDKQNSDPIRYWKNRYIPRDKLLGNVGRLMGLDLYISARKRAA